ncbi:MAG: DUF2961 domain-containing protein [Sedimentisphaerales bacterium]|nr:DUF2961 domain-containing protein [Sedimentisphaerales bacterium]
MSMCAADEVTFESLLLEMVNRDAAAQMPDPWFTCAQASSYERSSIASDQPGWFANRDSRNFTREENRDGRRELVLMDVQGPGAIVRFWGTFNAPRGGEFSNGTLRIYLDNYDTPAFEGPILDMLSGGKLAGQALSFRAPEYEDKLRCGHDLYLPIPYGRRCKVTYETKGKFFNEGELKGLLEESFYYQINYRTYAQGTKVQTLSEEILRQAAATREKVEQQLMALTPPSKGPDDRCEKKQGMLAPEAQQKLTFDKGGAIYSLRCKLSAPDMMSALRGTVLEISFDGVRAVWTPVGDFFGAGAHTGAWRTWWSGVDNDGTMTCYWVMPFQHSAEVAVTNMGEKPVMLECLEAGVKPYSWTDRTMYFHSTWCLHDKFQMPAKGGIDLYFVEVKGKGKYMGDAVSVFNGGWRWWGEGDEKIYVDGETFPSHFGTGTEDFYGYAWGRPEFYATAFIAQPIGEGNKHAGYSVNNRFRLLDVIPFKKSLHFDMEFISNSGGTFNYAPTTWWYAAPGAKWYDEPLPQDVREPVCLTEEDILKPAFHRKGAVEGEASKDITVTNGLFFIQYTQLYGWSNDRQLWWQDAQPGDVLTLSFDAPAEGRYQITGVFTKAADYGIMDFTVNGQMLRQDVDFYNDEVVVAEVDLGEAGLKKGANVMKVTIKGTNKLADRRYMLGLDCLLLQKK